MAPVTLFTAFVSPFGQRVHIALTEKCIPFEVVSVDLSNKPQEFLEANPIHKKVPTIVHDGKPVAESLVILEYLEDAFPGKVPLLPTDAYERSKVRFWVDYIVNHAYKLAFGPAVISAPGSPEKQASVELCAKTFQILEDAMISFSKEGPFFTGATFGLLDVVLAPMTASTILFEKSAGIQFPGPEKCPRLSKWMETVKKHPSVQATLPSPEETYNILSAIFRKRAAAAAAAANQ